ncbi:hypothetical protein DRP07_01970 [Archaeoglobales archaeon]|nr:MAG: hypothetical protein DRP07_01970 [Archaeoglobales archaeon]
MQKITRLGTYISKESYGYLRELSEIYGSQAKAMDTAIKLLYEIHKSQIGVKEVLSREKIFRCFDCVILTKNSFKYLINKEPDRILDEGYVYSMVKLTLGKDPREANFSEIIDAIREIYVVGAKWFSDVITNVNSNILELTFIHNLDKKYSEFMSKYFADFLENLRHTISQINISEKSFSIEFKKNF